MLISRVPAMVIRILYSIFTQTLIVMKFTIDKQEKYVLIKIQEAKLTTLVAPELKAEFLLLHQQEYKNMIVDMSETQYCDSSGLSALLTGFRLCRDTGGSFILAALQDHVRKLIAISQLDNMLTIVPTVNEAIDFIFMDEIEKQLHKG
jgi:anti-sigma B factor antagonist